MPKKAARKGAEARARAGNPEMLDLLGRANVESLLKAVNGSLDLDDNENVSSIMSTLLSSEIYADKKIQKSIQDTMRKITTGEFNDPDKWDYGDGDQSPVKLPGSQNLRTLWADGADYSAHDPSAPHLSQWLKDCVSGRLDKIKAHLEKEPRLLDRRESLLRMNGLMHVVIGFRLKPSPRHMECVRFLVEKGTPVDSKDVAGHTCIHMCTGKFGNKGTCEIAQYLLEKGADINIKNRFGATALFETVQNVNNVCVDWLLENGADPDVHDNDGVHLFKQAQLIPGMDEKMTEYTHKLAKKKRDEASKEGSYRKCNVCQVDASKRCSGCYLVWYCCKECQISDWIDDGHKSECKEMQKEYVEVELDTGKPGKIHVVIRNASPKYKLKGKSHFILKIQAPLHVLEPSRKLRGKEAKKTGYEMLYVYNEEHTVEGYISGEKSPKVYQEALEAVKTRGLMGAKAYFYAAWEEGKGLKINLKRVQPPESW